MSPAGEPMTVNVKKFIEDREAKKPYQYTTAPTEPMTAEEILAMRERWERREKAKALEDKLQAGYIDCPECGTNARPYINDYICFTCRDALE